MLDGVYPNSDRAAVFHEAPAPSTDELETVLLKIITRTMRILTRLGAVIEEPDRTYLAENGHRWRAEGSACRLVHLLYCPRPTRRAEGAELTKPAERSEAVRPRAACQRGRL